MVFINRTLKKLLLVPLFFIATGTATLAVAQPYQELIISPASGTYLDISEFDFSVTVNPMDGPAEIRMVNFGLNGMPANELLQNCMREGKTFQNTTYLLCKDQSGASFGWGTHDLMVEAVLMDGRTLRSNVRYEILQTKNISTTTVQLPTNVRQFFSGMSLEPMRRYEITATGKSNLWPSSERFPLATPRGNGTTCNSSTCPVRYAPTGALVGKIGNGPWFLMRDRFVIDPTMQPYSTGMLFLSVNDQDHGDNVGNYSISIKSL